MYVEKLIATIVAPRLSETCTDLFVLGQGLWASFGICPKHSSLTDDMCTVLERTFVYCVSLNRRQLCYNTIEM